MEALVRISKEAGIFEKLGFEKEKPFCACSLMNRKPRFCCKAQPCIACFFPGLKIPNNRANWTSSWTDNEEVDAEASVSRKSLFAKHLPAPIAGPFILTEPHWWPKVRIQLGQTAGSSEPRKRMESLMSNNHPRVASADNSRPVPFIDLVAQYQTIRSEIRDAVDRCFESQTFILGDEVAMLEQEIASYCDSQFAIGCASGTDALILALLAAGVEPGDEVITSPFTFFASAGAIHRVGAIPVLVDIEPESFNLDPEKVEQAITSRTAAIMPVHIFGQCAEMEPLWRLSAAHDLAIIEDSAQAIGAEYRGRRTGVLGSIGCFSFFPTKNLGGAGDGGIMTTDDPELAARLKRLRVHGDLGGYNHVEVGFNSRLDALQAAVLRVKLRHLDAWTEGRARNASRYADLIEVNGLTDVIKLPTVLPDRRHVFNQFTTRVTGGRRAAVMQSLKEQQIGCAVYYPIPLHLQKCFAYLGYQPGDLPEAERACAEVMSLPIYTELPAAHLERVVQGLCKALGRQATLAFPHSVATPQRRAA